ncbi:hypothetical protein AB1Y20_014629 [Prymnesium parvum]|uniref:Uncharacterized protein n=1 Tax=Prymnesium parvum TaxID=97485 RepID=A0AB34ICL3_PRYPA
MVGGGVERNKADQAAFQAVLTGMREQLEQEKARVKELEAEAASKSTSAPTRPPTASKGARSSASGRETLPVDLSLRRRWTRRSTSASSASDRLVRIGVAYVVAPSEGTVEAAVNAGMRGRLGLPGVLKGVGIADSVGPSPACSSLPCAHGGRASLIDIVSAACDVWRFDAHGGGPSPCELSRLDLPNPF